MSTPFEQIMALLQPQQPQAGVPPSADFGVNGQAANAGVPRPSPPEDSIVSQNPVQPNPPDQRMEGYRRLLTNFTYMLGTGLEAANANPRGVGQRTQAGIGAVLQVPQKLEVAKQAYALQQTKQLQDLAAARASEAKANKDTLSNLLIPAQIQQILAKANETNVNTGLAPGLAGAKITAASAEANKSKYISTPQGLFDISGPTPNKVAGSEPITFEVTPEIADHFKVPELLGQKIPTSTFNQIIKEKDPKKQLSPMMDPDGKTIGLYSVNLTDNTTTRLGAATGGLISEAAEAQKERIATKIAKAAFDNRQPEGDAEMVNYIANVADADPTGTEMPRLVGPNTRLRMQVVQELQRRDADLRILTASTRQLGETAHELMPSFDHVLQLLQDKGVQSAMGPLGSRWQEFLAGKIGTSDPAFRGIDQATIGKMNDLRTFVSLLQTGTARAHVGARGSVQLTSKFENLFNADKMDATTLRDTLGATKSFLQRYEQAVFGTGSAAPKTGTVVMTDKNGKDWNVPADKVTQAESNGMRRK